MRKVIGAVILGISCLVPATSVAGERGSASVDVDVRFIGGEVRMPYTVSWQGLEVGSQIRERGKLLGYVGGRWKVLDEDFAKFTISRSRGTRRVFRLTYDNVPRWCRLARQGRLYASMRTGIVDPQGFKSVGRRTERLTCTIS